MILTIKKWGINGEGIQEPERGHREDQKFR